MEDTEGTSLFVEGEEGHQTLLVYCEGSEEAITDHSSDPQRDEMLWVIGGGGGGEGALLPDGVGETLLLLGDPVDLLPTSADLTTLSQREVQDAFPETEHHRVTLENNNNNNALTPCTPVTYTHPRPTYMKAHMKIATSVPAPKTYMNGKIAYTGAHSKTAPALRTYTNTHVKSNVPKTYMNPNTTYTGAHEGVKMIPQTYIRTQKQAQGHTHIQTPTQTYVHTQTPTHTYVHTQKQTQLHTQAYPHTQKQAQGFTHSQTTPQTYIHTQKQSQALTHSQTIPQTYIHTQTAPQTYIHTQKQTHALTHTKTQPSNLTHLAELRTKLVSSSKSSLDEDELSEEPFVGPSVRWASQAPRSYRGAKTRDAGLQRKAGRKVPQRADTDGETSGMGSSVDEPVESSTESASEAPSTPPAFIQPRPSASRGPSSTSPTAVKKRRGGWPKGRKRKPELPGAKPPKAPLTAYVLFLNERRKYYRETRPELSFGAVTKVLGAEWSAMSVEQKAAFVTRSEQDKRRYRNELQAYRQSHDYQLLLRKKRIKNVIRRGGTTTEESSDFTDEIDDDDSEELYCRICDQLFTSLHNKREHLYGKTHLQAITGEYQRERLAEEERQMAAAMRVGQESGDCLTCGSPLPPHLTCARKGVEALPGACPSCTPLAAPRTPQEDEHDGDKEDEEEEEEEEEDEEEEGSQDGGVVGGGGSVSAASPPPPPPSTTPPPGSITEALEGVMARVVDREEEIHALQRSSAAAAEAGQQLAATLSRLEARGRLLNAAKDELTQHNTQLKAEAEALWLLPALFGVTPLQMVDVALRSQEQHEETQQDEGIQLDVETQHNSQQVKEVHIQHEDDKDDDDSDNLDQQEQEQLLLQGEEIRQQYQQKQQQQPHLQLLLQHDLQLQEDSNDDNDEIQQLHQQQQQNIQLQPSLQHHKLQHDQIQHLQALQNSQEDLQLQDEVDKGKIQPKLLTVDERLGRDEAGEVVLSKDEIQLIQQQLQQQQQLQVLEEGDYDNLQQFLQLELQNKPEQQQLLMNPDHFQQEQILLLQGEVDHLYLQQEDDGETNTGQEQHKQLLLIHPQSSTEEHYIFQAEEEEEKEKEKGPLDEQKVEFLTCKQKTKSSRNVEHKQKLVQHSIKQVQQLQPQLQQKQPHRTAGAKQEARLKQQRQAENPAFTRDTQNNRDRKEFETHAIFYQNLNSTAFTDTLELQEAFQIQEEELLHQDLLEIHSQEEQEEGERGKCDELLLPDNT